MKKNHARRAAFLAVCLFALCAFPAHAASPKLVPVGLAAGIALETQGARIVGFSEHSPAHDAGLMEGDSILYINETKITGASVLSGALAASEGAVEVRIARGEDELLLTVEPDRTKETPRLGVFVRDALAGIGTVTYYDPATGQYGALGHGISEGNEGLMPVGGGKLVSCTLDRIQPGAPGIPGELGGTLDAEAVLGTIECNTDFGIFGQSAVPFPGEAVEVLSAQKVRVGDAVVRCALDGKTRDYSIRILALHPADAGGRDMLIEVTDPDLLSRTGGIVRGMSGSPILQDGKLAGAVTHVLVSSPKRGYAVFAETMLSAAQNGAKTVEDAA